VALTGEGRGVYRVLVGRPDGERPLGRPRLMWENNIKMELREIRFGGLYWIRLAEDRVHKVRRLFYNKLNNYQLFKEYPALWNR